MKNIKKNKQLGMNPSTASGRLVKDILFDQLCKLGLNECHQCGLPMSRETFSIEHKVPWLDSDDPIRLYFDLNNVSFSHHSCNVGAARTNTVDQVKNRNMSGLVDNTVKSPEGMNWCNICKKHLPKSCFGKHKRRWNGLRNECKKCRK